MFFGNAHLNYTAGYYEVGTKKFGNKLLAVIEASRIKQPLSWRFFDKTFATVNPALTSGMDLRQLFRFRAQQLRDSYGYLVLYYSGGSDSWTMLKAFNDAGLHLDEIVVFWPLNAVKGVNAIAPYTPNFEDTSPQNYLSEWDAFLEEDLKWIKKSFPSTIVTIKDWSLDYSKTPLKEEDIFVRNPSLMMGMATTLSMTRTETEQKKSDEGVRTAYVLGVDRPTIKQVGKSFYHHFNDKHFRISVDSATYGSTVEYFYWTPNLPMLAVAQCRKVFDLIEDGTLPPDIIAHFSNRENWIRMLDAVKRIIRPDYDFTRFQSTWTSSILGGERHAWRKKVPELTEAWDRWNVIILEHYKLVDPIYFDYDFDGTVSGLKPTLSCPHYLGTLT